MAVEPDEIDLIVKRVTDNVTEWLAEHLDARYDALAKRLAAIEERIDTHASEIKHDTRFTRTVAGAAFRKQTNGPPAEPETPAEDAPRPWAIDRATSATAGEGCQRVDLDRYGTVAILKPGVDRDDAWGEVRTNLRHGRGVQ